MIPLDPPAAAPAPPPPPESAFVAPALQLDLVQPLVISTDRPSFSDGTGIEPFLHANLESGFTWTWRDKDDVASSRLNGPELLARVGLIEDRLEFRALWSGYVWNRVKAAGGPDVEADGGSAGWQSIDGWSDVALGLKLKAIDQTGWIPRVALLAQTTVGGGEENVGSQEPEPVVKLLWSYGFDGGLTIGGNVNAAFPVVDGERFTQWQVSAYLSAPLFDRCTGFVEWYMLAPLAPDVQPANYVDAGVLYLLNDRVQLDARIGAGLGGDADNFFAGAGISVLF